MQNELDTNYARFLQHLKDTGQEEYDGDFKILSLLHKGLLHLSDLKETKSLVDGTIIPDNRERYRNFI